MQVDDAMVTTPSATLHPQQVEITSAIMWMNQLGTIFCHGTKGEFFTAHKWRRIYPEDSMLHCYLFDDGNRPILLHVVCRNAPAASELDRMMTWHMGAHRDIPINLMKYQLIANNALVRPPTDVADDMAALSLSADARLLASIKPR